MSQTIGIATGINCTADLLNLARAVDNLPIDIVRGGENANELVDRGVKNFFAHRTGEWKISFLSLDATKQTDAFELHRELSDRTQSDRRPMLLQMLDALELRNFPSEDAYVFSATEWDPGDEVVLLSGAMRDLIRWLEIVQTTHLSLWSPETKRVQDSDRYPFVFHLVA